MTTATTTTFDITALNRRSDPECPTRRQVQCTGSCAGWHNLVWNNNAQCFLPINCHRCNIDLVPEPAAQQAAEVQEVAEPTADELLVAVNVELAKVEAPAATQEEIAATQAHLLLSNDVDQIVYFVQLARRSAELAKADENATQAYPGQCDDCPGRSDPLCCWYTEDKKPADPTKKQYFVIWAPSITDDKKRYGLLCRKSDGLAVDCSCGDRVHRGRKQGRACKHQLSHNAMLAPAKKATQAA